MTSKKLAGTAFVTLLGLTVVACASQDPVPQKVATWTGSSANPPPSATAPGQTPVPATGAPAGRSELKAKVVASIKASDKTKSATGIERWDVRQGKKGYWFSGMHTSGSLVSSAYARPFLTPKGKMLGVVLDDNVLVVLDPKSGKVVDKKVRPGATKPNTKVLPFLGSDVKTSEVPYGCVGGIATSFGSIVSGLADCGDYYYDDYGYACDDYYGGADIVTAYESCAPTVGCGMYGSCSAVCGGYADQAGYPDCSCYCSGGGYDYGVGYDYGWDYGDSWWAGYDYDYAW